MMTTKFLEELTEYPLLKADDTEHLANVYWEWELDDNREMLVIGREEVESQVVGPMYTEIFDYRSRFVRSGSSRSDGQGPPITQINQAGQLLSTIGLYLELKETIKYGRVGKLDPLFESVFRVKLKTVYSRVNKNDASQAEYYDGGLQYYDGFVICACKTWKLGCCRYGMRDGGPN